MYGPSDFVRYSVHGLHIASSANPLFFRRAAGALDGLGPLGYNPGMTAERDTERTLVPLYLKEWRKYLNLTQVEVAKRMAEFTGRPIGHDRVSKQENRLEHIRDSILAAWAHALGVEPAQLFGPPGDSAARDTVLRFLARNATDAELNAFKAIVLSRITG